MTIEDWLAGACADADRRGLPALKPLLATLADATRALRSAGWDTALDEGRDLPQPSPPAQALEAPAAGADERPSGEGASR